MFEKGDDGRVVAETEVGREVPWRTTVARHEASLRDL